ncbi:MAG: hypothetical protein PHQ40_08005 [Anaerolineaceae bacterium]|nr:hypothetical protein [Anaerolineaceae bacterium]
MRLSAASQLSQAAMQGSAPSTRILALALSSHLDPHVREIASNTILHLNAQPCLDASWDTWVQNRNPDLLDILLSKGQAAHQPPDARVYSLLLLNQSDGLIHGRADVFPPLFEACSELDTRLSIPAHTCMDRLASPEIVDTLCTYWVQTGNAYLGELIAAHDYIARTPVPIRVLSALQAGHSDIALSTGAEGVEALISALRSDDLPRAERARECLLSLQDTLAVDAFCTFWAKTRSVELQEILLQVGYVAQTPVEVRVLSALKTGRNTLLEYLPAENIDALVNAAQDRDGQIASGAQIALQRLRNPETQDALCRLVIQSGDPQAELAAIQARYEPEDPGERALFLFLTGQWQKYDTLDFDRGLLSTLYAGAAPELKKRVLASLQHAGRTDFLSVVAGGNFHSRAEELGNEETEILTTMLATNHEWSRLWKLALLLPFRWSVQILRILTSSGWQPAASDDLILFHTLSELVSGLLRDDNSSVEGLLPPAVLRATIRISGRINAIAFAPSGSEIAIASSLGKVAIWNYHQGQLAQSIKGFAHSVGTLTYTQNGDLFAGERSLTSTPCGIYLWSNNRLTYFGSHRGAVTALIAAGPGRILSTGRDQLVRVWDISSQQVFVEKTFHFWPRSVCISAEGHTLALLHKSITLVSLPTLEIQPFSPFHFRRSHLSETHASMAHCALFTPASKRLLVGQNNGQVISYEPRANRLSAGRIPLTQHTGVIQGLAMVSGRSVLVSAGSEGGIHFTDWTSQHTIGRVSVPVERLTTLSLSSNGAFMAVGDSASKLTLWDLRVLDIPLVISRPMGSATLPQLAALDSLLTDPTLPAQLSKTLRYIQVILRHRFQYDIEVSESIAIRSGEFDIIIDGALS